MKVMDQKHRLKATCCTVNNEALFFKLEGKLFVNMKCSILQSMHAFLICDIYDNLVITAREKYHDDCSKLISDSMGLLQSRTEISRQVITFVQDP